MIKYLVAQSVVGILIGVITMVIILHKKKQALCDSCKHLEQKGGKFKYICKGGKSKYSYDCFDNPPEYCAYYEPIGDQEIDREG